MLLSPVAFPHRSVQSGLATILTAVALLILPTLVSATGTMTISCIDVGQGDATLIESPSGMTLLFDAGSNGDGDDVVIPYVQSRGLGSLDYLAASHYHADHIGGLDEVYDAMPVNVAVLDRGWSYTTLTYNSYATTVAAKRQTLTPGQVIDLGEGVTVTCVALNGNGVMSPPYDDSSYENEYDVCLLVEYGGFDFFVAGDLTGDGVNYEDIETSVGALTGDVDIYRVNHHGSDSSSNASFLQSVQAEEAIISVGDGNSYHHPTQAVLDRLVNYGSYVYQTETGTGGTLPAGATHAFTVPADGRPDRRGRPRRDHHRRDRRIHRRRRRVLDRREQRQPGRRADARGLPAGRQRPESVQSRDRDPLRQRAAGLRSAAHLRRRRPPRPESEFFRCRRRKPAAVAGHG